MHIRQHVNVDIIINVKTHKYAYTKSKISETVFAFLITFGSWLPSDSSKPKSIYIKSFYVKNLWD